MIKYFNFIWLFLILSCEKEGFLNRNVYYNFGFKNSSDRAIVIYAYELSNKLKSYNLKSKETLITNSIYTKDIGVTFDPYFYPYQADSVVVEFDDKKKVSFSHILGVKKYPRLIQLGLKFEKIRSRKWSINNTTLIIINDEDYALAK
jgi:hypothetical protein